MLCQLEPQFYKTFDKTRILKVDNEYSFASLDRVLISSTAIDLLICWAVYLAQSGKRN